MKSLITRIREPDPIPVAFGRRAIRYAIREAFRRIHEANSIESPLLHSQEEVIDVLMKRYSSIIIGFKVTGVIKTEEEVQDQLDWYSVMIPYIVKTEFRKWEKTNKNNQNQDMVYDSVIHK
jgi:hypothetical protein